MEPLEKVWDEGCGFIKKPYKLVKRAQHGYAQMSVSPQVGQFNLQQEQNAISYPHSIEPKSLKRARGSNQNFELT